MLIAIQKEIGELYIARILGRITPESFAARLALLQGEKQSLLETMREVGVAIEPEAVPECSQCNDQEFIIEEKDGITVARECTCRKNRMLARRFFHAGLTPELQKLTFANFDLSLYRDEPIKSGLFIGTTERALAQAALKACRDFVDRYRQNPDGIYLFGSYGVGKTHLAAAIANELLGKEGLLFIHWENLLTSIKATWDGGGQKEEELLDTLYRIPVLIIDDFAAEREDSGSATKEWVRSRIGSILHQRMTYLRPTVITSNFNLNELKDIVGARIVERITMLCQAYPLIGTSQRYRVRQQKKNQLLR